MPTNLRDSMSAGNPWPTTPATGSFCFLPVEQLRTSYAGLRPGAPHRVPDDMAQLPIRVVPTEESQYEVIDGFKRLTGWRQQGQQLIPVVIEPPGSSADHKRVLLMANSPPRTLTALDEARVVCSLMSEEGLSAASIARRLGRKPQWVARRVEIGRRLSPSAEGKLARGEIGPTLAHALCALSGKEQEGVLQSMDRHGLKLPEVLALISAYRVADEEDRKELLRSPLGVLRPEPAPSPAISPTATVLERRLQTIQEALVSLAEFTIPEHLAPAERRRLEARLRSVLAQLQNTACAQGIQQATANPKGDPDEQQPIRAFPNSVPFTETWPGEDHHTPRDPEGNRSAACLLRHPGNRSPGGVFPKDRSPCVERAGLPCPWAADPS